jgi:hypothetical protein
MEIQHYSIKDGVREARLSKLIVLNALTAANHTLSRRTAVTRVCETGMNFGTTIQAEAW